MANLQRAVYWPHLSGRVNLEAIKQATVQNWLPKAPTLVTSRMSPLSKQSYQQKKRAISLIAQ